MDRDKNFGYVEINVNCDDLEHIGQSAWDFVETIAAMSQKFSSNQVRSACLDALSTYTVHPLPDIVGEQALERARRENDLKITRRREARKKAKRRAPLI